VLGVLQVVLGQNPIAGGMGVTRELLIFLVDVLGGAANLDVVGPLESKARFGVVLRPAALPPPPLRLRPRWRFIPLKSRMSDRPVAGARALFDPRKNPGGVPIAALAANGQARAVILQKDDWFSISAPWRRALAQERVVGPFVLERRGGRRSVI